MSDILITKEKKCTKCGETKPATLDFFCKHDKCLYGVNSICKECEKKKYQKNKTKKIEQAKAYYYNNKKQVQEKQKEYREKNKDALLEYNKNYYKANSEEFKQKQREYYYKNKEKILKYMKQYKEANREKILERVREHYRTKGKFTNAKWKANNPEKVKKHSRDYYYRNKEKCLEMQKKYKEKNKELISKLNKQWRKENKERDAQNKRKWYENNVKNNPVYKAREKEYCREWVKLNKDKIAIKYHKRAALKRNLLNDFNKCDWEQCLEFFDYKDAYTGLPMETMSQDHVIPISKGGSYTKSNIVPCEKSINSSKWNNDMEEWYRNQPFFSKTRLDKIYEWIS